MQTSAMAGLWQQAGGYDRCLRLPRERERRERALAALARKRIAPRAYSPSALFEAIAGSRPAVLQGVPVPVAGARCEGLVGALVAAIERGFGDEPCARAQVGAQRVCRRLAVPELMRRWASGRHLVSVTDLHVRGTPLARSINTRALSRFNLLPLGGRTMQRQEMMTLVVASAGNVTDSHSDDPDGSNHCFVGRKLWLAWDTFEGSRVGLQDCERELVNGKARFDLARFCALPGARWWTVEAGQTLFLPGRFAHRVITLEPYIGIGSFYVTPTSCLDSLTRWYAHGPLWSQDDPEGDNDGLVDRIAAAMQRRAQRLARGGAGERDRWGLPQVALGLRTWRARWPAALRTRLAAEHPPLARVVEALEALAAA